MAKSIGYFKVCTFALLKGFSVMDNPYLLEGSLKLITK